MGQPSDVQRMQIPAWMKTRHFGTTCSNPRRFVAIGIGLLLAASVAAQPVEPPTEGTLTGVLKRVKEARVVHLGVRDGAVPFSFLAADTNGYGYSVDLCREIVADLAAALGLASLAIEYVRVTPTDRIEQIVDGRIDLECGATTNTVERRQRVAFSPLIFMAGTRLVVQRGSRVRALRDLTGRSIVVVRGTTNEEAMRRWVANNPAQRVSVIGVDDYPTALASVGRGEASALAADDILMTGYLTEHGLRGDYAVVGDLLSYEPYGIMYARDDLPLTEVVEGTFARLARTREIRSIYNKWFVRPLPSGARLGLPMSPYLERSFEVLGLPLE
jgi:ABC-type amino acid transport substrate-binding protein